MSTVEIVAKSGEAAKAGPLGFAIILLLCVACYFLFKSMSKHLKAVRENFPAEPPVGPQKPVNPVQGVIRKSAPIAPPNRAEIVPRAPDQPESDGE
jgi:hypothetical protein